LADVVGEEEGRRMFVWHAAHHGKFKLRPRQDGCALLGKEGP
jgi:hypothetical protein